MSATRAKPANSREALTIAAVAALAVYALALLSPAIFNDGDTYWHIRAGQWMLSNHAVLDHDVFSSSFFGRPWDTQEWLSEITLAVAFQALGWSGVAVLTGLATAIAVGALALYLARHLDPVPCIVVLVLGVSCVMPDYLARPHILALPCLVAWVVGLATATEYRRAPRWLLLPVMTLWANLHGGFVFGMALIFPFALEAVLSAQAHRIRMAMSWGLFATGAVAAALLNPRGLGGLIYPFALMNVHSLSAVGEWQSLDLRTFGPVEFAALVTLFFLIWRGVKVPPVRALLLLALFHLSLEHARYGMLLGVTGAILIAESLGAALGHRDKVPTPWPHRRTAMVAFATVMLILVAIRVAYPIRRVDGPASPISALSTVPPSLAAQPVFNNYSFGGYLIFKGIKPLVDSRADMYGDAFLSGYARAVNADTLVADRLFRKYRVAWTMLAPGDPLVAALDRRPGWRRLFVDRFAVVQVGPGPALQSPHVAMQAK